MVESFLADFARRFLADRTFDLVVAPALADLQFEHGAGRFRRTANRLGVVRAVAGGLRSDVARGSGDFLALTLLPAGYHIFLLILCFDFFSISLSTGFFIAVALILVLSLGPVVVCFWPERAPVRSLD